MPRALLLLLPLLAAALTRAADVFVIADTVNQTHIIADNAKETIAEANDVVLASNDSVSDIDDHEPVVRKKRTFGDVVFRGLADVLGYSVARKPPQIAFPPPLAPVPGIDTPLQAVAVVPLLAAVPAPPPAPAAPPCGAPRAAAPPPCRAQAPPPPPPPKPTQPPCPRPRANPRPKPRPKPRPAPPPPPPPPCGTPRANPTTPSPCAPAPPPPKADSSGNLETITSNFRLNFNFNRAQATPAPQAAAEEQIVEQQQEQFAPVPILPQAALLPQDPPRTPRVYLDAFVVRNGVAQKVQTADARNLNQNLADDDYLVYDEVEQPPQQDDDYEYVDQRGRSQAVRDFGDAVDQFWQQKKKKKPKKKKLPQNDYRNVHFGDRELANQLRQQNDRLQYYEEAQPQADRLPFPIPEAEEDHELTTTTQDPRRRLKPRVLPPTEHNPNEIDTVTVRVPPIYKEKRPKKLHRKRPEEPDRDEYSEDIQEFDEHGYDSESDNSDTVPQTEKPKRKRRRKPKRRTRSAYEPYTAGDYDYYGKKLPISDEEKYFRGLTIPPPTKDADLVLHEEGKTGGGHFLDDHERIREDPERIKNNKRRKDKERVIEKERADESERSDEKERSDDNERTGDNERADETERTDKLSPNAKVRETGYKNNYVHATNVQVDDARPRVATVKRKKTIIKKA